MSIARGLRATGLGIVGAALLALILQAPAALASANANWGTGVKATPPAGGTQAVVNSVSCASPGNCTAVGYYIDGSVHTQGMLLTETAGTWTQGVQAALPAGAATNPQVSLTSVSCASVGNCTAAGNYVDTSGHTQGLLVTESGGAWGTGIKATPAATATDPFVVLTSVSCPAAAACVAAGNYFDGSNHIQGVLVTQTSASSATEAQAPLPPAASAPNVSLKSVSCPSAGSCTAVGDYLDTSSHGQGLLLKDAGGSWTASAAGLPADGQSDPGVDLTSVSCASAGNCSAVGKYFNAAGHQGVLLTEASGSFATGAEATLPADAAANPNVRIDTVSCASAGSCSALGTYTDATNHDQGLLLSEAGGTWAAGVKASMPAGAGTAGSAPNAQIFSVSCTSPGNCEAVGNYLDSSNHTQGLLMTESSGTWAQGVEATLPAGAGAEPDALLNSVSCPSAGGCTAAGEYTDNSVHVQGVMIGASPTSPTLSVTAPATGTAGSPIAAGAVTGTLSAGVSPIGTITFAVFGPQSSPPSSCSSGGAVVGTATASGNGTYVPSAGFTPAGAGDYWWYASYGGDAGNGAAASACGSGMPETVVAAPSGGGGTGGTGGNGGTGGTGGTGGGGGTGGASTLSIAAVKVSGATAIVQLSCGGAAAAQCNAKLVLTATEKLKGGKVLAVTAVKIVKRKVSLGSASTTLTGGQRKTVRISLNATGRRLLASLHRLSATLTVTQGAKPIGRRTLTFRAPAKRRK